MSLLSRFGQRIRTEFLLGTGADRAAAQTVASYVADLLDEAATKAVRARRPDSWWRMKKKIRFRTLVAVGDLDEQLLESLVTKMAQPLIFRCAQHGVLMKVRVRRRAFHYSGDPNARVTAKFRALPEIVAAMDPDLAGEGATAH